MKYLMRKMILNATWKVYLRAADFSTTECGTEVFVFLLSFINISRVFCDFFFFSYASQKFTLKEHLLLLMLEMIMKVN